MNLIETIKVSETYTKRTADEDAEKVDDKPKIFMSDYEYYGPEVPVVNKVCDYSPRSINRMFKDSLPIGSETPRQDDRNLFSGV